MDDWIWVESPGTSLSEEPRVLAAQFGDGYRQLAPDGLNTIPQSWSMVFNKVDDPIAAEMIEFLRAHKGTIPFSQVPLWATAAIAVTCGKWNRVQSDVVGQSTITATFDQWFGGA